VGLPESGFVFCCFNNSYKITPSLFERWLRLLKAVPGSVLWLFASRPVVVQNLREEARRRGADPERLVFAQALPYADYLARMQLADLFLDTSPFNGGTTASDALWAGVPVLTCPGEAFASRMAASLLNAIGLPELITNSLEEYESLALELARNSQRLADIKSKLARNRGTYPLFDTDRFRRHIEAAYVTMWERYQRGEPPASFTVEPCFMRDRD
jgi:predicted O-linked N-acetylglucosamine transferase (SPINDLY family)